jgi:membrane protease YdiL (CAAX protease family)
MQIKMKTKQHMSNEEFYKSFSKHFEGVQCRVVSIFLLVAITYFFLPYSISTIRSLVGSSDYLLSYLYSIPTGLLVLILITFTKIEQQSLTRRTLGLALPMPRDAKILIITLAVASTGILVFLAYFKLRGVDIHLINPYSALDMPRLRTALANGDLRELFLNSIPHVIAVLFTAPIIEEIYFSGLVFATLRNRLGFVAGLAIASALFSLHHAYADPFREGQLLTFSVLFASQALSFALYQTTRSLYPSIAYHFLRNLVVLFVELSALV